MLRRARTALCLGLLAAVALAAGLVVGCACPHECRPARCAAGPATPSIAGVVRDEQGLPIPNVGIEVDGYPTPINHMPPIWYTDVRGQFEMHDIAPGPVKLLVTPARGAKEKIVDTRTGVRDLVIVLDPGPQLILRIVDYVPGPEERGARVTWKGRKYESAFRHAPIRADGWVRFVALPPDGEFEMWALADRRRHVRARSLKPGPTEQRIERHEVRDIAGRITGSEATLNQRLPPEAPGRLLERLSVGVYPSAPQGGFWSLEVASASVQPDGSFRIHGLPPGTYLLYVHTSAGEIFGVSKVVEAGTTDAIIDIDGPRSYAP